MNGELEQTAETSAKRAACEWPVVIIGAGPAGLAAALRLVRLGMKPLIVSRVESHSRTKIGESIAPASWPVFLKSGIDRLIDDSRHLPSPGTISSWGSAQLVSNDFLAHPYRRGWHLDRNRFEDDLGELVRSEGVPSIEASVARIDRNESGHWALSLDSGYGTITASFLIDASGRSAVVSTRLGTRRIVTDRMAAWFMFMRSETPTRDARAWIEAVPDGWWYSALLPGGDLVAVFFCDPDEIAGQQQEIDRWLAALDSTTFTRLRVKESGYVPVDSPRTAGAGCSIAEMISGNGWVACGDAAAAYDPVSSHGIATAIASGQDAAEAVFFRQQGDSEPLARYVDRVRRSYFHCMRLRREVYSQERRWPDSRFWNRRSERLDIPESSC